MIDWNKPIRVVGDHRAVHVIANPYVPQPGDEPTVLVLLLDRTTNGKLVCTSGEPLRRNLDGTNHHSNGTRGSAVKLENVPEQRVIHYFAYATPLGALRAVETYKRDPDRNLTLTFEGERLVGAEFHAKK